jgi:cyclohexadieny/prephenate dehydrogenase
MADVADLRLVDELAETAAAAVVDADLVIMAVPVGVVGAVAEMIVPSMKPGAVLTDTGSTKRSVLRDVTPHLSDSIIWLPSHPLAGTEHSGPQAGIVDLFDCRWMHPNRRFCNLRHLSPGWDRWSSAWHRTIMIRCWR